MAETVVLIPIRSFADAKSRLADVLEPDQRRSLVRTMAETVVKAAVDLPVAVLTDDAEVAAWADGLGVRTIAPAVDGLNESVTAGVALLAAEGVERAIVAHADLPRAADLRVVAGAPVAIAPDRGRNGSNVLAVPTDAGFRFAYGPGSFGRHLEEARRLGLAAVVIDDPDLAHDIDEPSDLA